MSGTIRHRVRKAQSTKVTDVPVGDGEGTMSTDSDMSENDTRPEPRKLPPKATKWQKFWTRFVPTWIMIFFFFFLIYIGHTAIIIFVWILQFLVFNEIAALGAKKRKEKELASLHWWNNYLLFCSLFWMYGITIAENIVETLQQTSKPHFSHFLANLIHYHLLISFILFIVAFIRFVLTLKPGYYKYQFKQLGWCICIIVIAISQSTLMVSNIMDGLVWWFFPSALIITNDIWAYMFGIAFGKTPLIHLSPRKTWEGAIGGGFATLIFSVLFGAVIMNYVPQMGCAKKGFDFQWPVCDTPYIFQERDYIFPEPVADFFESQGFPQWTRIRMAPFVIHGAVISLFASIVGPFGGFFASGFKRAFGLKDFGNSIPGHGGITDRFDCQILMGGFVFVYRKTFVRSASDDLNVQSVLRLALLLTRSQQRELLEVLQRALGASAS